VLFGLALGHYLPHTRLVFLLAVAGGVASALLTEGLSRRLARYGLPILGLPFLVFAWLVIAFASPGHAPEHWLRPDLLAGMLPRLASAAPVGQYALDVLRVFGSAFFCPGALSGLLVFAGLLVVSRISAAVGLGSALVAALLTESHPMPELNINLAIVAVGLVFFLAPGRRLLWQVPAGIALTAALAFGLDALVGITHLPYLILPLTVTLFAALLLGRRRMLGVELVPMMLLRSPDDHFRTYARCKRARLALPFFGTWWVSQGVNGGETHKGLLAHAWDFMVRDERGRSFVTPGYRLADYHAFGLLVCAPAAGRVVAVENSVGDNAPGRLNREQNWGNYVVIEHSCLEFSILAHLAQGSVRVRPGEQVSAGAIVGACGNSGYSGQPHLHYQLQAGFVPGSDALPAMFHHYLVIEPDRERLVVSGLPGPGETVQPLPVQDSVRRLLESGWEDESAFRVTGPRGSCVETWRVTRGDGELAVFSAGTRVRLRYESDGLAVRRIRGSRRTLLARTFEGVEFLPFYSRPGLELPGRAWRHRCGARERLADGTDALLLESVRRGGERRIWFAEGAGIARVEWVAGARHFVAEREPTEKVEARNPKSD